MAEQRSSWLIVNPRAGRKGGISTNSATPDEARSVLERHGVAVEMHPTERQGHATELAREAARAGVDLVVAAGGDGTVHEVATALIGTPTTLGVLPLGSVMNIARALNVPRDLDGAAEVIHAGRVVHMDVGKATTRTAEGYFLEAAGVGVDAIAVPYANQVDAGRWGAVLPLMAYVSRYFPRPARVTVDGRGEVVQAFTITVAIGPFTALAMAVAPDAKVDDRQFDVVVREGFTRLEFARHIVSIAFGRRVHHPKARTIKGRVVEVVPVDRKLMVHADGHSLGMAPVRFELIPAALSVLVGEAPAGEPSAVTTTAS